MKRPREIRTAPREWIRLLRVAYSFLRELAIGDLVLFGSQALSLYMRAPLRSKDLDLVSRQVSLSQMEELAAKLSELENVETKTTTVQTRKFDGRKMTTFTIELRVLEKPFFIELFDSLLDGRSPSILHPYVEPRKRWNLEVWAPTREAVLALRLAFRPPEGIIRPNAIRLNSFIRENRRLLNFKLVGSILRDLAIEDWAERNLIALYKRNRVRIINDHKIIPGIARKLKG